MAKIRSVYFIIGALLLNQGAISTVAIGGDTIRPPGKRVVGGDPTTIDRHPWQVAFSIELEGKDYLCGGSVISQRWLLSAAHCFEPRTELGDVMVKANVTDYRSEGTWIKVSGVFVHPDYNPQTVINDIALVRLDEDVGAKAIPLASQKVTLPIGEPLEVTGWGTTKEGGDMAATLTRATVPFVSNETCNEQSSYNGRVTEKMLCAGHAEGGTDSCRGDSGGPLTKMTDSGAILIGIVSWGDGCARQLKYGVYTRVNEYRDWINSVVKSNSD